MNSVILMGRLTRDPEVRYSGGASAMAIARYRLAVDRRFKREGQPDADFFDCVAFGRAAEFAEKYFHQGTKIVIQGRLQNDNYQDKEGRMVYRDQIVVESQEFAESKAASRESESSYRAPQDPGTQSSYRANQGRTQTRYEEAPAAAEVSDDDGFMNIPEGIDEELPFA